MATARMKILFGRFMLVTISLFITLTSIARFLIYLPSQIRKRKQRRQAPPRPPKVRIYAYEPESANPPRDTLLFVHGFPDCADMYKPQILAFTTEGYRCLVVDMPGSRGEPITSPPLPQQVVEMMHSALMEKHQGGVTIVAHDWGAIYSTIFRETYPEVVRRVVLLDVAKFQALQNTEIISIFVYQALFAFLYLLGDPVGTIGVQAFMRLAKYDARPIEELTVDMCYSYYGVFKNPGLSKHLVTKDLRVDEKTVPHLFVHGSKKVIRFHDDRWLEFVRQTPCGEVVPVRTDHWVSVHGGEQFNTILKQWLLRSEEAASKVEAQE